MTATELKVRDLYSTVPEMGVEAVRRPLAKGVLATYFESIKAAYEAAGLKPACNGSHPDRPGFEDETGLFQVALTEYKGYAVGRFLATSFMGTFAAEHVIGAQNGEFSSSAGQQEPLIGQPKPFELTRGHNGTLALVSAYIMDKANAGLFEPVAARPTLINVL
jgi:hypothetical protein